MYSLFARAAWLIVSAILLTALMTPIGCSDARKSGDFNSRSGKHETGWLPRGHAVVVNSSAAGVSVAECTHCHGEDLKGGIAGVSCTTCHIGGILAVHPADWLSVAQNHSGFVNTNGSDSCANQYCHGASLEGIAQSGPSCSSCHLGGAGHVHPETWTGIFSDHAAYVAVSGTAGCSNQACHGTDLAGIQNSGPSCVSCHLGDTLHYHPAQWSHIYNDHGAYVDSNGTAGCATQACHGLDLAGVRNSGPSCTTCHGLPFSRDSVVCTVCHGMPPDGAQFPNRAARHAKHLALPNVTCSSCHDGAGGSTVNSYHYNGIADVFCLVSFNSKSSVAAYDSVTGTCSNVSCHGGPRTQTLLQAGQLVPESTKTATPSWSSGSIAGSQCTICHVYGAAEFNSYWSGQHRKHVYDKGKICTECHDPALLATSHFTSLNTPSLPGYASATLRSSLSFTYIAPTKSCNPYAGGVTTGCHDSDKWETW